MPQVANRYKPDTAAAAKAFEGAVVHRWWEAAPGFEAGWYRAHVLEVTDAVQDAPGLWVLVRYDDDDEEDLSWEEVFCKPQKTRVAQLPKAVEEILRQLGFESPVKRGPLTRRKRPLTPATASQPERERKPLKGSVAEGGSQAGPSRRQPTGPSQPCTPPGSRRRSTGNRRKSAPMSLTRKKRRLQEEQAAQAEAASPGNGSDDSSAPRLAVNFDSPNSDAGGAGPAASANSEEDEELRRFDERRREINKGKRKQPADEAAAHHARRAAGGAAGPLGHSPESSGTAFPAAALGAATSDDEETESPQRQPRARIRRHGGAAGSRSMRLQPPLPTPTQWRQPPGSQQPTASQPPPASQSQPVQPPDPEEIRYPGPPLEPNPDSGIGHAGQIAKIHCENFMCHEHFEMSFGSNIVFISGTNGSGKTAVMNAIQVCLGATARETGRASSATAFVRTGCSAAVAAVTIWNTGEDAFYPQLYGERVTVQRRITAAGSSTWRLSDQDGRKVGPGNRDQVDELLNHFSIEATNPAVCMGQDTCRQFASETSGRKKYELFMQATHQQETIINLNKADEDYAGIVEKVKAHRASTEAQEKELREVERSIEALQEVEPLKRLEHNLQLTLTWQHVYDKQKAGDAFQQKLEVQLPETLVEYQADIEQQRALVEAKQAEKAEQEAVLQRITPQVREVTLRQGLLRDAVRTAGQALRTRRRAAEQADGELAAEQAAVDDFAAEAATAEAEYMSSTQRAQQDYDEQLAQAQRAKEAAAASDSTQRQQLREAEVAMEMALKAVQRTQQEATAASRTVTDLQRELSSLRARQGDPVMAFGGQPMKALLRLVEAAVGRDRFHRPPLGPLGSLLTLTDEAWAVPVEVNIGKMFDMFIVHNHHDLQILKELGRQARCQVSCVVFNFDIPPHDLNQKEQAPEGVTTMLSVLQIQESTQSHTVRNLLIDQKLERAALLHTEDEALRLMRGPLGRRKVITAAWAQDGSKAYNRGQGTSTLMRNHKAGQHPRLRKDVGGAIRQVERRLQDAQDAADRAGVASTDARAEEQATREAHAAAKRAMRSAVVQLRDSQAAEDELLTRGPDLGANPGDLQQDLANRRGALVNLQREAQEAAAAVLAAERAEQEAKEQLDAARAEVKELTDTNRGATTALAAILVELPERRAALEEAQQKVAQLEGLREGMQAQLLQHRDEEARDRKQAHKVCTEDEGREARQAVREAWVGQLGGGPRRSSRARGGSAGDALSTAEEVDAALENAQRLSDELERVQHKIRESERTVGASLDNLQGRRIALTPRVERARKWLARMQSIAETMRDGLRARKRRFTELRKFTQATLAARFREYMATRQYLGDVSVDRQAHTLTLHVSVNMSDAQRSNWQEQTDLKGLSGGERSYSTLAFTMALENVISVPFCCLDEFDVFMDAMNRTLGLQLLIEMSLENPTRQLILLSPQDVSAIQRAKEHVLQRCPSTTIPENFIQIHQMQRARDNATAS